MTLWSRCRGAVSGRVLRAGAHRRAAGVGRTNASRRTSACSARHRRAWRGIYDEQESLLPRPVAAGRGEWDAGRLCDGPRHARAVAAGRKVAAAHHSAAGRTSRAALELALRQAGRSLHEGAGHEPQPVGFVTSLGLATRSTSPRSTDAWTATRGCAQARRRGGVGRTGGDGRAAATGAVETVDFKGRYGLDLPGARRAARPLRPRAHRLPDAVLEEPHDLPRSPSGWRTDDQGPRRLRRADPRLRRPRRPARSRPRIVNVKPFAHRRPAGGCWTLRPPRGEGVRRYGGGMGEQASAAARSSCSPRSFTRTRTTTSRRAAQPRRPARRPAGEPVAGRPAPTGFRRG